MTRRHDITVVVALIPGGDCLGSILTGLGRQEERHFGLIIVDARPESARNHDILATAAATRFDARIVPLAGASRAASNNLGIRLAASDLVLLLAHDFAPSSERFVSAHLALHRRDPNRKVVGVGPGLFPPALRESRFRRWLEDSGEAFGTSFTVPRAPLSSHFFYCANVSAKRRFLLEGGLFDARFPFDCWDDAELGARLARAGMQSVLVPEAVAWHEHPVTLAERRQTMRRAGASAAILESLAPGPHAWQAWARQPTWRTSAAARWRLVLAALLPRHSRLREEAWRRELGAAFASGYQAARHESGAQ